MYIVPCLSLTDPNNGVMTCSLGDDRVSSYEDTCSFTCNTGYELTGSDSRTCQSDGSWSGSKTMCKRGVFTYSMGGARVTPEILVTGFYVFCFKS